jgi:hypothetical protein
MNSCCAAHGIGEVEIDAEFLKVSARVQLDKIGADFNRQH